MWTTRPELADETLQQLDYGWGRELAQRKPHNQEDLPPELAARWIPCISLSCPESY
jgi:hypothetical protein